MLSHMLDCQLFGVAEGAGWHHMVNLALHAANTVLLFIALRRMTGAFWRSALVAALFGLHPLHVESVAWVSERKDVLSTLFFMLTLLAYHHYVQRPTILRYAAVFVLLALGLMSKPMLVTVPLVLLLLDYWPLGRHWAAIRRRTWRKRAARERCASEDDTDGNGHFARHLIVEKIPLLVLAAISAAITYGVQQLSGAMGMLGQQVPLGARLGNALYSYGQYLEKSFWPNPLAAIYPYTNRKPIDVLIVGLALVAISVAAFRLAKIRPFLLVGWCWYLGTLVPVIGLVQVGVQSMADRYTYIPLDRHFHHRRLGRRGVQRGLARSKQGHRGGGGVGRLRMVRVAAGGDLVQQRGHVQPCRGGRSLQYLRTARAGHGLLEGRQAGRGAATIRGHLEDSSPIRPSTCKAVWSRPIVPWGCCWPCGINRRRHWSSSMKRSRPVPNSPSRCRHKAWILATSLDGSVRDGKKAVEWPSRRSSSRPETARVLGYAGRRPGRGRAVQGGRRIGGKGPRAGPLHAGRRSPSRHPAALELFKSGMPYHAEAESPPRP